jgi:hypothetical protein
MAYLSARMGWTSTEEPVPPVSVYRMLLQGPVKNTAGAVVTVATVTQEGLDSEILIWKARDVAVPML